jgi:hypothetical protein
MCLARLNAGWLEQGRLADDTDSCDIGTMASNEGSEESAQRPKNRQPRRNRKPAPPLLPDVTKDESGAQTAFDDDWYLEQRPPHHGA